jgi:hypothetical protein
VTFTAIGVSQAFNRDQEVPQIRLTHRDGKKNESTIVAKPRNTVVETKKGAKTSHL